MPSLPAATPLAKPTLPPSQAAGFSQLPIHIGGCNSPSWFTRPRVCRPGRLFSSAPSAKGSFNAGCPEDCYWVPPASLPAIGGLIGRRPPLGAGKMLLRWDSQVAILPGRGGIVGDVLQGANRGSPALTGLGVSHGEWVVAPIDQRRRRVGCAYLGEKG